MRQDTKSRLAVSSMIDLALHAQAGPTALATIASRQQVSLSNLEQLFVRLRTAGLVQSTLGPGGGYSLGRHAEAISVADIVAAVYTGVPGADEDVGCASLANDLSERLDAAMQAHMSSIALADLVVGQRDTRPIVGTRPRRSAVAPRPQPRRITEHVANSVFQLGTVIAMPDARPFGR